MWSSKKIVLSPSKSENGAIFETSLFYKSKILIASELSLTNHLISLEFYQIGYNKEDDLLAFFLCLTIEHFQTWVNKNIFSKYYLNNIHISTTFDCQITWFCSRNGEWMMTFLYFPLMLDEPSQLMLMCGQIIWYIFLYCRIPYCCK